MKKILITILLTITIANAQQFAPAQYESFKTPIENLQASIQWSNFMKEFEITMETQLCTDNLTAMLAAAGGIIPVGLKSHMIEPLGFVETTRKQFYFPSFDINLGKKTEFGKTNNPYNVSSNSSSFRSATTDAHYIKAPLMGMIFKKKIKFLCFAQPEISFPFLSEFYPGWKQDKFEAKVMLPYVSMMTPQGMLTGILEVIAVEVANAKRGQSNPAEINLETIAATPYDAQDQANQQESIYADEDWESPDTNQDDQLADIAQEKEYESQTMEFTENLYNSIVYMFGADFVTVGGYIDGMDPVAEAQQIAWTTINKMAATGGNSGIQKQTNRDTNGGMNNTNYASYNTMCRPRYYPIGIQSQYSFQQSYPVIGSAKEGGVMGIHHTGKYRPAAEGVSYTLWSRRDYAALAYSCPWK